MGEPSQQIPDPGFSDTESTSLSVRGITASNGSLSFQASTPTQEEGWTFTPNKDFNNQQGNVEINYVLDDGSNGYIFATNTLSLIAVNDALSYRQATYLTSEFWKIGQQALT